MRYRLVIFDMDGTLADSFPWFTGTLNSVADRFHFRRIEPGDIDTLRRMESREILRWLGVPLWKLPRIATYMRTLKAQHIDGIALFPGVDRMLHDIAASGIRIAIVSSDSEANVRRTLGPANAQLVDFYACGASLFGKQAKFRQVLKRSRIDAGDTIAVGDELRDAEAAAKSGIDFGAVSWGYAHSDSLGNTKPALLFSGLGEIAPVLSTPRPRK